MNWRDYEKRVYQEMVRIYPYANIHHNVRLPGRFSRTTRQVDILVTGIAGGLLYRTVVDTKLYNRKIDVKHIEQFIGMIEDLDCSHGMIVSEKGFTPAAEFRAVSNPHTVAVDIVTFADLASSYQSEGGAIPWVGEHAVLLNPPLGWIVDCRPDPESRFAASLHSRSYKDRDEAMRAQHYMYLMITPREAYQSFDELLQEQAALTIQGLGFEPEIEYSTWMCDSGRSLRIRQIYIPGLLHIEVTAFVEFDDFFCYVVLVMPLAYQHVDFPRLVYVCEGLMPMGVRYPEPKE